MSEIYKTGFEGERLLATYLVGQGRTVAPDAPATPQRLGFLAGEIAVPDAFDRQETWSY